MVCGFDLKQGTLLTVTKSFYSWLYDLPRRVGEDFIINNDEHVTFIKLHPNDHRFIVILWQNKLCVAELDRMDILDGDF